jgi:hypothetical protein
MSSGIPLGAMYTHDRVRKLRTEERLAAIAQGVSVPMVEELSDVARSRRWGIPLFSAAIEFMVTFRPGRSDRTGAGHLGCGGSRHYSPGWAWVIFWMPG